MKKVSEILKFQGTWRSYQARVLESADNYLKDDKMHIVAAPGSGKTTLGIEMLRRIGENALILTPSVTIREQWVARICEAFLVEGIEPEEYISQNLKAPKSITVATYQALHSAMTKKSGTLSEADEEESDDNADAKTEEVDFTGFDLIKAMREADIKTLCLDECHHLRSEWWKALEDFKTKYKAEGLKTIALTATPPYDSTPQLWKRYADMCGEIDEEITIPELVKEGSLCPHQDFVYFNYPTETEKAHIEKFEDSAANMVNELKHDMQLLAQIKSHKCLNGEIDEEKLLDNPGYLSSILIFLRENNVTYPAKLQALLGATSIPPMEEKWMEYLLQGFVYEDKESYAPDDEYRGELLHRLKMAGLLENKKITFTINQKLEKEMAQSKGKCKSIRSIVMSEYDSLGTDLRMLILTDFIRREQINIVGDMNADANQIGVIPFFEMLRRAVLEENKNIKLGVLCGTIVIIPASAKNALLRILKEGEEVSFGTVGKLGEEEYVTVSAPSTSHFLTGAVTELFTLGGMEVLIGTKSLLGEGWDSPCINSLILASFVGAFMLSNQMRGRAIRVFKKNPEKTSNIWHLVCLKNTTKAKLDKLNGEGESPDYKLLERRMEHFLGLHYEEASIENGIDRLSIIEKPFNEENVEKINQKMCELASKRDELKERWTKALDNFKKVEVSEHVSVKNNMVNKANLSNIVPKNILKTAGGIACGAMCIGSIVSGGALAGILGVAGVALLGSAASKIPKIRRMSTPKGCLEGYGKGLLEALKQLNLIDNVKCNVVVESDGEDANALSIKGGSTRDKTLYAQCVDELFGAPDNQRYLLKRVGSGADKNEFYCVPECFGKKKEDAAIFYECMKEYMGNYNLVYTRNEAGRKVLLEARSKAYSKGQKGLLHKQKAKSALE